MWGVYALQIILIFFIYLIHYMFSACYEKNNIEGQARQQDSLILSVPFKLLMRALFTINYCLRFPSSLGLIFSWVLNTGVPQCLWIPGTTARPPLIRLARNLIISFPIKNHLLLWSITPLFAVPV